MKQNEADRLASNMLFKFGLPLKASIKSENGFQYVLLEPEGIHRNEGFQVSVRIGWRSLMIDLLMGKFAADLLQQMGSASLKEKQIFSDISQQILDEKGVLIFKVNECDLDPLSPETWSTEWRSLSLSLRKVPIEINTDDYGLTERLINIWTERFFACILALIPLEDLEEYDQEGFAEGSVLREPTNRYERNRYNRSICINFHGSNCKVCGLDFGVKYGSLGEGFIHVHHVTPISQLGPNYFINPIKDLVPVCPNCHAMLHKQDPPLSVEELKNIINPDG